MKVIVIIFCFVAVVSCTRFVVKPQEYFTKLYDNIVVQIIGTPGTVLSLEDFVTTIDNSTMSKKFDGTVKFHSGFVNRIAKLELTGTVTEQWNDTGVRVRY